MKIERRLLRNFDWITLAIITLLSIIGIMSIYSATRSPVSGEMPPYYIKQLYWLIFGIIALAAIVSFDYIWLFRFSYVLYGAGLLLLLLVIVIGRAGMGAQRWISLGIFSFQPSEIFKLFYAIAISRYLSEMRGKIGLVSLLRMFAALCLVPLILIIKQPDLSTAIILLLLFLFLTAARGLEKKVIVLMILIGVVSVPFLGNIFWGGLKDYQKNRIVAFMEPEVDPSGIGYHINQSKVAIGSGEIFGKGYLKGTQGPFRFLPEKHTDFIFAVFAEEWGFMGSVIILLLYLVFILRGINTAVKAKDEFGSILALSISLMFAIYFFINIGMTLGIMPVVGIPLPFMSYGGTALLTNYVAAGVLINIRTRRFELFY